MLSLDTWQQSATFNPADPTQKKIEKYVGIPGQYATFYFNRVPNPGTLKGPTLLGPAGTTLLGLRGLGSFSFGGLLKWGLIAGGLYLVGTKTKFGRKAVAKGKSFLPRKLRGR